MESAWQKAYSEIKSRILSTKLKPGDVVSEIALAKELTLSRAPVREAIRRLEQEGLVESKNRRKHVFNLSVREIDEIFELKTAIEGNIARLAVTRKSPEQTRALSSVLERMNTLSQHDTDGLTRDHPLIGEWLELDREFHHVLYEMAQNPRAEQLVGNLNSQWHRLRAGILATEGRLLQNIHEHLEVGREVISGDADKARELMVDHLERLHKTISAVAAVFQYPA